LMKVIKQEMPRVSYRAMRKLVGWDSGFMEKVLMAKF